MSDKLMLYDLASRVKEIANSDDMQKKRSLWRAQNSFKSDRPLIYLRAYAFSESFSPSVLKCTDPMLRSYERYLHETVYRSTLGDDYVIEPWVTLPASYVLTNGERWGVRLALSAKSKPGGAAAFSPILGEDEEDFSCLRPSPYLVDEKRTAERYEKLSEALGDTLPVYVQKEGPFGMWNGDISTDIAKICGLDRLMWDVYDRPEWLHSLLSFMRDTILENHRQAEAAGGYSLADHQNQCIPYAEELEDPDPTVRGVSRKALWRFTAAQEFTCFSPEMFNEFILEYQIPIMEEFGLSAYGCCEDLTRVIPYLRKIKNLRRIAVSPFANARSCSEQIGKDYILSFRPDPALMVSRGLDEELVRKYMREHFAIFKENHNFFDITLKDVETVSGHPENIKLWTQIVREEIVRAFG